MNWSILFFSLLGCTAFGADIIKTRNDLVIFQFDIALENFVVGQTYPVFRGDKKVGQVAVLKIKSSSVRAQIVEGEALVKDVVKPKDPISEIPTTTDDDHDPLAVSFTILSNSVWRGVTSSANGPVVQGEFDYAPPYGLGAGVFITTLGTQTAPGQATSETDLNINLLAPFWGNCSLTLAVYRYIFTRQSEINSWDYTSTLIIGNFKLELSYIPDFFGAKTSATYEKISQAFVLHKRFKLTFSVGNNRFAVQENLSYKNYLDYKIKLGYTARDGFGVDLAWTTTNRKNADNLQYPDETTAVIISKSF